MGCGPSSPENYSSSHSAEAAPRPAAPRADLNHNNRIGRPVTQAELDKMRSEFWSSRVEGNSIMWQALRSACDAKLNNDDAMAFAIIEASGIRQASPETLETCYDERGFCYVVPFYCFREPLDLVKHAPAPVSSATSTATITLTEITNGTPLKVRLRVNPGDYSVMLDCFAEETLGHLKQKLSSYSLARESENFPSCESSRLRIMFMGKELKDNAQSLSAIGVNEDRVVQVFLRPKPN